MVVLYQLSYPGVYLQSMLFSANESHLRIVAENSTSFNKTLYTDRMEGLSHYEKEIRPWGDFERFTLNETTTVKIITVKEGESISLQTHEHRDEFWRVLKGSGIIHIGDAGRLQVVGQPDNATAQVPHHCLGPFRMATEPK